MRKFHNTTVKIHSADHLLCCEPSSTLVALVALSPILAFNQPKFESNFFICSSTCNVQRSRPIFQGYTNDSKSTFQCICLQSQLNFIVTVCYCFDKHTWYGVYSFVIFVWQISLCHNLIVGLFVNVAYQFFFCRIDVLYQCEILL